VKNMIIKQPKIFLFVLINLLFISGCAIQNDSTTATLYPSSTGEGFTSNPTFTRTPSVIATQTSTPIYTHTPLPTLSSEDAMDFVKEMIKTNGGCEFPCWWGITPGKTSWNETRHFIETFVTSIEERPYRLLTEFLAYYPYPQAIDEQYVTVFYVNPDKIIELIVAPTGRGTIQDVLLQFGPPSEIWIRSTGNISGLAYYQMALLYTEKSIMILFDARRSGLENYREGYIPFCAKDFLDFSISFLWPPDTSLPFTSLVQYIPGKVPIERYGLIIDVSDIDETLFYNLFSTDPEACFETKEEIWPFPPTPISTP